MSFQKKSTFSMLASRERQHKERIPRINKYKIGVLPISAIYGGNASGKTNFFKALSFVKNFVVKGSQPESLISVETFKLDSPGSDRPTSFSIEILTDETIFELSFTVTRKTVIEEKLIRIEGTSERVLYKRSDGSIELDEPLRSDPFLEFAFKGTRDNQLFLTNSISQKVENFRPVYDWFKDTLELIAPDARFEPFEQFLDEENPLYSTMNEMLPLLDTGIMHIGGEVVPMENIPISEDLRVKLQEELKEGATVRLVSEKANERYIITRKDDEYIAKKLVSFHKRGDGAETKFDIRQESDGSQRVIDLLPAFLAVAATNSKKVFVIDEVDRSLHTLLTRQLLDGYLSNCSKDSRAQLLFTTHDVLLMDQKSLRRDEMWVTERNCFGSSDILSFSEYKDVRYDKDIRKSYLQGRLGGIPRLLFSETIRNLSDNHTKAPL